MHIQNTPTRFGAQIKSVNACVTGLSVEVQFKPEERERYPGLSEFIGSHSDTICFHTDDLRPGFIQAPYLRAKGEFVWRQEQEAFVSSLSLNQEAAQALAGATIPDNVHIKGKPTRLPLKTRLLNLLPGHQKLSDTLFVASKISTLQHGITGNLAQIAGQPAVSP